jgi:hypothetical protein
MVAIGRSTSGANIARLYEDRVSTHLERVIASGGDCSPTV